jgi:hypothetical protein
MSVPGRHALIAAIVQAEPHQFKQRRQGFNSLGLNKYHDT